MIKTSVVIFIAIFFLHNFQTNAQLKNYFPFDKKPKQIFLPDELVEISGITKDKYGNIFCHNDEQGIIYEIDISSGRIINKIIFGNNISGDFEDIVFAGNYFYLLRSDGVIFQISLDWKNFNQFSTGLNEQNDCEGLFYEPETNSLLIACKNKTLSGNKKYKEVYKYNLKKKKLEAKPFLKISLSTLKIKYGINGFYPSSISKDPDSKNYFILSAKGKPALIEIDSSNNIKNAVLLDEKRHPKPEGLLFLNGKLLISDEGVSGKASISTYYKK